MILAVPSEAGVHHVKVMPSALPRAFNLRGALGTGEAGEQGGLDSARGVERDHHGLASGVCLTKHVVVRTVSAGLGRAHPVSVKGCL